MHLNSKMLSWLAVLAPVAATAEGVEDVLIPIVVSFFGIALTAIFFLTIAAVIIVAIIARFRINALKHEERMLAIERGQELPVEPIRRRDMAMDTVRGGLVLTFLGIALSVALGVVCGPTQAVWGGIPFAIGVALLVYAVLYRKFKKD